MEENIWRRKESLEKEDLLPTSPVSNEGPGAADDAIAECPQDGVVELRNKVEDSASPSQRNSLVANMRKVSDRIFRLSNKVEEACQTSRNSYPIIQVDNVETKVDENTCGSAENGIPSGRRLFIKNKPTRSHFRKNLKIHPVEVKLDTKPELKPVASTSWTVPSTKDCEEMGVPSLIQKQHADEHKIKAFVSFMFLCIVLLVGFAHIFFNQKVAQHSYFESVRFLKENRTVHISDASGQVQLRSWIGMSLPDGSPAYKCRPKDLTHNGTDVFCFEWIDQARLEVTLEESDQLRCYGIYWKSLSESFSPLDCFDMANSPWFGGGLVSNGMKWSLNKLNISLSPFVTGEGEEKWGRVLRRRFISANGAAIVVDDSVPLWVGTKEEKLCIGSKKGYPYSDDALAFLNYSICIGKDAPSTVRHLADNGLWDGIRKDEMEVIRELLYDPVWRFDLSSSESSIVESLMNFTNRIISVEWTSPGYLLLTKPWEAVTGNLEFDSTRFKELEDALEIIHRKGFKVVVEASPFFSTFSSSYREGLQGSSKSYWISQPTRGDLPVTPAFVSKDGDKSMVLLDPTYAPAAKWFSGKLGDLKRKYHVDAILLDVGTSENLPRYFETEQGITDPSTLASYFLKAARLGSSTIIATTSAVEMPKLPTFVSLPAVPSNWEGLRSLLPSILTLSVIGYPFILTPPVGGNGALGKAPSKELYLRWLQFNTFLPVVQFGKLPFDYDSETMEVAEKLAILRRNLVMPVIKKIADDSVLTAGPIIRPIWFLDPSDPKCFDISLDDEFCIGDDILVAPILTPGSSEREIYLPRGVWKDGIDGSLRKGGRWLHNHKAELHEIPYFIRMPEGTRL